MPEQRTGLIDHHAAVIEELRQRGRFPHGTVVRDEDDTEHYAPNRSDRQRLIANFSERSRTVPQTRLMSLMAALQRSKIARRLWHVLPYRVRGELWKTTHPSGNWTREVMNRDIDALFESLGPSELNVVEVSGTLRSAYPWASYTRLEYPEFDLCDPTVSHSGCYDLVICEQVLEHVENPITAVGTLKALCAPSGMLLVSTPFLVPIHPAPEDFWRFTPNGLRQLLECQGLRVEWVRSWGNRAVVRRNLRAGGAPYRPGRSLKNEPTLPVVVWALARIADDPSHDAISRGQAI